MTLQTTFIAMLNILATLLALTFIFGQSVRWLHKQSTLIRQILIGVVFGLFGVFNVASAVELVSGIILDLRNPLVLVAGIYGGAVGAVVSAVLIALYRVMIVGGVGAGPAVFSIMLVAIIAIIGHRYLKRHLNPDETMLQSVSWRTWVLLGLSSVVPMIISATVFLPQEIAMTFIRTFIPVAIVMYPVLTVILGNLMASELGNLRLQSDASLNAQRFRAIFDKTFQFMGLLTPDGTILEANQTFLDVTGVTLDALVGKKLWEVDLWLHADKSRKQLQEAITRASTGEFVRYHINAVNKMGISVAIDFSLKPIVNQTGEVVLIIPEGRDISHQLIIEKQRQDLQSQAEQTQVLKQFIEDSSHHLRTPITILNTKQYLINKTLSALSHDLQTLDASIQAENPLPLGQQLNALENKIEKLGDYQSSVSQNVERLEQIIEELLNLARLDQPETQERESIELTTFLEHMHANYVDLSRYKGLSLKLTIPQEPVRIEADHAQLTLVMQNLIENAMRYSSVGGRIEINCQVDDAISIRVTDSGIGIPEEDQEKIFDRFYRSDNAREYNSSGTGLGLAIVKKIVTHHQGTITVDSTPDVGTTFTVTLPKVA